LVVSLLQERAFVYERELLIGGEVKNCELLYWNEPYEYLTGKVPTAEDLERDYTKVWEGDLPAEPWGPVPGVRDTEEYASWLFYVTNTAPEVLFSQEQLRERGGSHTSMSVGDVAVVNGVKLLCRPMSWLELNDPTQC